MAARVCEDEKERVVRFFTILTCFFAAAICRFVSHTFYCPSSEGLGEAHLDGTAAKLLVGVDARASKFFGWLNRVQAVRLG